MKLLDFRLSSYGDASGNPAPINRMMASFAADFRNEKDINLGVGYVNEQTIPGDFILMSMGKVLSNPEKYKAALNYGGPHGSPNLINSIREYYLRNNTGCLSGEVLDKKEIIIGPNGATSLLEGIAGVLEPGIVITSDPMYYIYCDYLERMGFKVVAVPEDCNGISTDLLKKALRDICIGKESISFFYIVTVNNPTGTILSNNRRAELVRIVEELSETLSRKIPLVFDKAYEDLVHDKTVDNLQSGFLYDELGLVYEIGTLSKILSPALRIGYMVGSQSHFLRAMVQKTSDAGFSASLIMQEIASYMLDHYVHSQIETVNREYREKAERIEQWINDKLGMFLEECRGGKAGFYFYLTFKDISTTEDSVFFRYLARTTGIYDIDGPAVDKKPRVIYVPGKFCVHPMGSLVEKGERQLRLSYGFEEMEKIEEAIDCMRDAAEYLQEDGFALTKGKS